MLERGLLCELSIRVRGAEQAVDGAKFEKDATTNLGRAGAKP